MVHIKKFNESIGRRKRNPFWDMKESPKLSKDKLEWFTDVTNRSKGQTEMLYDLVDGDWGKLKELELKIRIGHIQHCPSTKEEANKILNTPLVNFLKDEYFEEYMDNFWTLKKRIKK